MVSEELEPARTAYNDSRFTNLGTTERLLHQAGSSKSLRLVIRG